ncbi:hypothetical protein XENORESO_011835 [Xenotaenia resolanae]|uniref:Uncharacterized protein n=1 Tax=Xenotaenia resolanae TaxID=208358 RepID=A0ABV0WGF5_9TELE
MVTLTLNLTKLSGPTVADEMAPQVITGFGSFTLDFKQLGFCVSTPMFAFPNEIQTASINAAVSLLLFAHFYFHFLPLNFLLIYVEESLFVAYPFVAYPPSEWRQ